MSPSKTPLTTKSTFIIDTSGLFKFQDNSVVIYTVLTFLIVAILYFTTKDWKGVTAPEELDLGCLRVPHRHRRRKSHYQYKQRDDDDY